MSVRRVRIDSVEDLEALPEDEWVLAPEGINVRLEFGPVRIDGRDLRIRLPPLVVQQLKGRGRRFRAKISDGELVVENAL